MHPTSRPATRDDLAALLELQRRWDTHWFGAPEHDLAEVSEALEQANPLEERSRLLVADMRLLAACWHSDSGDTTLLVDPASDASAAYDDLLPWLRSAGAGQVEALDRDTVLQQALVRHGWDYRLSSYELIRPVADWALAAPAWPADVQVRSLEPDDGREVHDLIYKRAGWADVPGHPHREFEPWRQLFLVDAVPEQQVLAWRGSELLGVALGKTFSDGTGWVSQLAVARSARGAGLGRALLLEALGRRVRAGATALGLNVSAANPDALGLYLDVGLTIDREWRSYHPD